MRLTIQTCLAVIASVLISVCAARAEPKPTEMPFHSATTLRFAPAEEAAALLGTADSWVEALSSFDRAARMRRPDDPGQGHFLDFAAAQSMDWTPEQISALRAAIQAADERIESLDLQLSLPSTVLLIRTSGEEESNAAYTRANAIILPDSMLGMPQDQLEQLFLHELFHIMSRHEPAIREPLYGVIGYSPCANVPFPAELLPLKMTNPDAFGLNFCIDVEAGGRSQTVTPILFAKGPYSGGTFFDYLVFRLMAVERSGGQWQPVRDDAEPRLFGPGEVSNFFEQIGTNTNYVIHPEETIANNFVFALTGRDDLPDPDITARLLDAMRSFKTE